MLKKTGERKRACGEINALAGDEKKAWCARLLVWRPLSLLRAVQVPCAHPHGLQKFGAELYLGISSG